MRAVIAESMQKAFDALKEDGPSPHNSHGYAFHCGEAGGIAAVARVAGVRTSALCDDISDAYEDGDAELMRFLLDEVRSCPRNDDGLRGLHGNMELQAPAFDNALQEALHSKEAGDSLRCSLLIGFVVGLMYRYQGPGYRPLETVRDEIINGYETGCDELLHKAGGTLGSKVPAHGVTGTGWQEEGHRVILIGTTTNPIKEDRDGQEQHGLIGTTTQARHGGRR